MEEKLDSFMAEVRQFKAQIEDKFTSSVSEIKNEMTAAQEKTSQQLSKKIGSSTYQFRRKGNEHQYNFNCGLEDAIDTAKSALTKASAKTADPSAKEAIRKAELSLDEGTKALAIRQKHIKIADRSDLSWGTVKHYMADPLADGPEDEKEIKRCEKEAQKDLERAQAKKSYRRGGGGGGKQRRMRQVEQRYDPYGDYGRRERYAPPPAMVPPPVPQRNNYYRPRMLGPCFRCGAYGHIQSTCTAPARTYPLVQPVVSTSAEKQVSACGYDACVDSGTVFVGKDKRNVCMGNPVNNRCVDGTGCHPEEIKADLETYNPVACESVNRVIADAKITTEHCIVQNNILENNSDPESSHMVDRNYGEDQALIGKFWELDSSEPQVTDVQGRLRKSIAFWKEVLHAPPPILDCIENGYRLPLKFIPPSRCQDNHQSAKWHAEFVNDAIKSLLDNRCIRKLQQQPYLCSPLSVVANSSAKLRLVLNLKYLNNFLHVTSFKYEDLRTAALMFEANEYLFKFDLKSGYHHDDVHPDCYKFLGFQWEHKGIPSYFVFTVLPFGLSTACYLFTKIMRPLVRYWRGRGLKAIVYLDDGVVAVSGWERALHESKLVQDNLKKAGFIVNIEKSEWQPSTIIEWLGFTIDLSKGEFSIPEEKIKALKSKLVEIKSVRFVPARHLASVIGKISSMSLGLGPVSRLMTRSLYATLNKKLSWFQSLEISSEASTEVEFWLARLEEFNGQDIWPKPSAVRVVYSDASATGYGGYTVEHGNLVASGQWSSQEATQSSTWRELRAVRMVLESFKNKLRNERI